MSKPVFSTTTREIYLRAAELIEEAGGMDLKPIHLQQAINSLRVVLQDIEDDPTFLQITRQGTDFLRGSLATLEALQASRAEDDDAVTESAEDS